MTLAFHYTTGDAARGISASGVILPATRGVPPHEIPVVWFSLARFWEPTASKRLVDTDSGAERIATLAEMTQFANGLVRFAVPTAALLRWSDLISAAHIRSSTVRHLERVGRQRGALPSDWYGALSPVALCAVVHIERLVGRQWQTVDLSHQQIQAAA